MIAQEMDLDQACDALEKDVSSDQRVQDEFRELNTLLEQIAEAPIDESPKVTDSGWKIDDPDLFRWLITLEGRVNLERIACFRQSLLREDEVIDAQVVSLEHGQICIRVVTTGGLPMGPLELAVGELTANGMPVAYR